MPPVDEEEGRACWVGAAGRIRESLDAAAAVVVGEDSAHVVGGGLVDG